MKTLIFSAVAAVALTATTWAQAPDRHNHAAEGGNAPAVTQPRADDMIRMMGGTDMMRMMQGVRMGGPGTMGMGMIEHLEGRIAFLHAELKITAAQTNTWNSFADALRANSQTLAAIRPTMMPTQGAQQTLTERLDVQERWLTARLEGLRAIKTAFTPLFGVFSDEQKRAATELLGPHLGLAMMSGPMVQMGPEQMGLGRVAPR